jgi:hypothetical protein
LRNIFGRVREARVGKLLNPWFFTIFSEDLYFISEKKKRCPRLNGFSRIPFCH